MEWLVMRSTTGESGSPKKRGQFDSGTTPLPMWVSIPKSSTRRPWSYDRYSLYVLMLVRNELRSSIDCRVEEMLGKVDREMLAFCQSHIFVEGKSMADLIEDSAHDISGLFTGTSMPSVLRRIFSKPEPLFERLDEDEINVEYELCLFCEEICQKMAGLVSFLSATGKHGKLQQILNLQSIYENIRRYREAYISEQFAGKLISVYKGQPEPTSKMDTLEMLARTVTLSYKGLGVPNKRTSLVRRWLAEGYFSQGAMNMVDTGGGKFYMEIEKPSIRRMLSTSQGAMDMAILGGGKFFMETEEMLLRMMLAGGISQGARNMEIMAGGKFFMETLLRRMLAEGGYSQGARKMAIMAGGRMFMEIWRMLAEGSISQQSMNMVIMAEVKFFMETLRMLAEGGIFQGEVNMAIMARVRFFMETLKMLAEGGISKVEMDMAVMAGVKFFMETLRMLAEGGIYHGALNMAIMGGDKFSMETQEKEQDRSNRVDVEGEAMVDRGKISMETVEKEQERSDKVEHEVEREAAGGRDKFSTETEMKKQERSGWVEHEVEGEAVLARDKFSTVTEEKQQERSGWVEHEVQGEAAVGRGEVSAETELKELERSGLVEFDGQAIIGGGKVFTETGEEAPWIDHYYNGESVTEIEEESFADYRRGWEDLMGEGSSFENSTLLSSMLFTHCTPGCIPVDAVVGRTFQVYSVKIAEIKGIQWPLKVYGVVAARDEVDKHRNPLFLRSRDDCQILHQEDPFLHLTGPSRAIVSEEPIEIEIQLRVKRGKKSNDKALISQVFYNGEYDHGLCSSVIENHFCKIELSYEQLEQSVQATIFGVHVAESSPFEYGVRLMCSSLPPGSCIDDAVEPQPRQVLLFHSRYKKLSMGKCGYLNLSRQVVSVDLEGKLRVLIQAYASGGIVAQGGVFITPQKCNTSPHTIDVGGFEVKFTVAWSLLVEDKTLISMTGYVDPLAYCPPLPPYLSEKLGLSE